MLPTNEKDNYRDVLMNGKRERATQPTGMTPPSKAPTNDICDAPQDGHETNNTTAQVMEHDEIQLGGEKHRPPWPD